MKFAIKPAALAVALALPALGQNAIAQDSAAPVQQLDEVVISASKLDVQQALNASRLGNADLSPRRAATSDTASLLKDIPGVSLYGAGGVSSLPAIHGMADDRIRIRVDGMDLISACANHMNSPLSYIDPSNVGSIKAFAGISPVSAGGDSIAGSIQVDSPAPEFARAGETSLFKGQLGTFYRSNGNAKGGNLAATAANEKLSMSYSGSTAQSENYKAARDFKAAGVTINGGAPTAKNKWLSGDEVGASAYRSVNQSLSFAVRHEDHQVELKLGLQHLPYQGFPNQYMDMTANDSHQVNLRYNGKFGWGALEARVYNENTRHKMNKLDEKLSTSFNALGMPMDTEGKTTGAQLKANIAYSERDTFTVGGEYLRYRLDDWWDPVSTAGSMGGGTFVNINNGQRDRIDAFGEWDARWPPQWQSQLGIRYSNMTMNTGNVQGYNTTSYPVASYAEFNAADRKKVDHNVDLTALVRYTPDDEKTLEAGYARKTRSPNLYERFAWSTNNTMVMTMINWTGDGNGYVGDRDLKPEVAHTLSATAGWHDAAQEKWALNVTPYYTYVQDYIDARRCPVSLGGACTAANLSAPTGFVYLQYANQNARLYGVDVSGYMPLAKTAGFGSFTATGAINYVNGRNRSTDDNLYNIMPLNAKLAAVQRWGSWTNSVEGLFVDAKTHLSQVRNEQETGGYSLFNLRSSYDWKQVRLDLGVENLFNKYYAQPLGGAYLGQRTAAYGTPVPGIGRSIYTGLNIKF